ncbi:hypothetical protein M0805_000540 [Coniferiporia weirii]|nr:hypothetical protein M0805_000540 [Coniferiporia weirii]
MQDALRAIIETSGSIRRIVSNSGGFIPAAKAASTPPPDVGHLTLDVPDPATVSASLESDGIPKLIVDRFAVVFCQKCLALADRYKENYQKTALQLVEAGDSPLPLRRVLDAFQETYQKTTFRWLEEAKASIRERIAPVKKVVASATENTFVEKPKSRFNQNSVPLLEDYFEENMFPSRADKAFLARKFNMTYRQIHVWFQNRRSRSKKISTTTGGTKVSQKSATRERTASIDNTIGRSSPIATIVPDSQSFPGNPPPCSFPAIYPPVIAVQEDPFPCRFGDFSCFSKPHWPRRPAVASSLQKEMDMSALCTAFSELRIGDDAQPPRGLRDSAKRGGCDVTSSYTVRPMRAPLISLIRNPSSSSGFSRRSISVPRQETGIVAPKARETQDFSGGPQRPRAPVGLQVEISSALSSLRSNSKSLPAVTASVAKPRKLFKIRSNPDSARQPPHGSAIRHRLKSAAQVSVDLISKSSTPSTSICVSSTPLRTPFSDSEDTLPSLSSSSSNSSTSSETHSPVASIQLLSEESLPPAPAGYSTLMASPITEGVAESFWLLAPQSDYDSSGFSKGLIDEAFCYDLPTCQSYLFPKDGFLQGV